MVQFLAMLMAVLQTMQMLLKLVKAMLHMTQLLLKIVLESMLQMTQVLLKVALESMPSPLEIVACIVVANGRKNKCHDGQMLLAAFVLVLALCEWHVPKFVKYCHAFFMGH